MLADQRYYNIDVGYHGHCLDRTILGYSGVYLSLTVAMRYGTLMDTEVLWA